MQDNMGDYIQRLPQAVQAVAHEFVLAFNMKCGKEISLVNATLVENGIDFEAQFVNGFHVDALIGFVDSKMVIVPAVSEMLYAQTLECYGLPKEMKYYSFKAKEVEGRLHVGLTLRGQPCRIGGIE